MNLSKPDLPKISVITPSFNQGKYIKETIDSVLAQEYPNFEHIVIDGGSTDDTVSILKSYKHLQWVSEPDEGQADALNKGFARATGDIIAWINSDDWYAPGAFHAAIEALKEFPIIVGMCTIVDDKGKVLYTVPNTERNWFDILKYWVPYSIPTQPSIFFKRDLLEFTKREKDTYLDKSLYYTMDYDLWLRTSLQFPLIKRVDKVLAFYRSTETSKTSHDVAGMAYAEPEMSYVFHRAETVAVAPTYNYGIIVPVTEPSAALQSTLETLLLQSVKDFEVMLVDHSGSKETSKQLRLFANEINRKQNTAKTDQYIRIVSTHSTNRNLALNEAIELCEARYICVIPSGALVGSDFLLNASRYFAHDRNALCLPIKHTFSLATHFATTTEFVCAAGQLDFRLEALLSSPPLPQCFVARKTALLEIGDLAEHDSWALTVRKLALRTAFKGWHVSANTDLPITFSDIPAEQYDANRLTAQTISDVHQFYSEDPFFKARAGYGIIAPVGEEMLKQCQQIVAML